MALAPKNDLVLGGITFTQYESPDDVRFVPTQNVYIHKFIGGARHIDVLGEDDDTIKWSGTFLGTNAENRAALLNAYVVAGEPQILTFGKFGYQVVVKQVTFDYRNQWMIDYAIECYTVQNGLDEGQANANIGQLLGAAGNIGNAP